MSEETKSLDTLVQEQMEADTEFVNSLEEMSEEDKQQAINDKHSELRNSLYEQAQAEAKKKEEIARNQEIRAKKAEELAKKTKTEKETPKNGLSLEDLDEASELLEIPKEDRKEVMEYAKFKGISISEAKKDPVIQTTLRIKQEERKTAEATSVKDKRGMQANTNEKLLREAEAGNYPTDPKDIDRLVQAEFEAKLKASQAGRS